MVASKEPADNSTEQKQNVARGFWYNTNNVTNQLVWGHAWNNELVGGTNGKKG